MEKGDKIYKKISDTCHVQKKPPGSLLDSSKIIISHLFWFQGGVLDNILTTARGLAEYGLSARTT